MKITDSEWDEARDQIARGYEEREDLFSINKGGDKDRPIVVGYDMPQIGPLPLSEFGLGLALIHWNNKVALLVARHVLRERARLGAEFAAKLRTLARSLEATP